MCIRDRFNYSELDISYVDSIQECIDWTKLSGASIVFTEEYDDFGNDSCPLIMAEYEFSGWDTNRFNYNLSLIHISPNGSCLS